MTLGLIAFIALVIAIFAFIGWAVAAIASRSDDDAGREW